MIGNNLPSWERLLVGATSSRETAVIVDGHNYVQTHLNSSDKEGGSRYEGLS